MEHLWRFVVILLNTMLRPDAILDLRGIFVRWDGGYLVSNPPGRKQIKKRRPIIPVAGTPAPWLLRRGDGLLVSYGGKAEVAVGEQNHDAAMLSAATSAAPA